MILKSLELSNFRNYSSLSMAFDPGTNILYGQNAQGKTNILEAIYISATTKSHKKAKDREVIAFGESEGHIRTILEDASHTEKYNIEKSHIEKNHIEKTHIEKRVDMHLQAKGSKVIAIDKERIKRASQLMGILKVVLFSPEDLSIIKDTPSGRRRFLDVELCQLDPVYLSDLTKYQRAVDQRVKLIKDGYNDPYINDSLDVWDLQVESLGENIIKRRRAFIDKLNPIINDIHKKLSGGREDLNIEYSPDSPEGTLGIRLKESREKDLKYKQTGCGPHRDDFLFKDGDLDLRKFGSQGQQRCAALSLKLAEIAIVEELSGKKPLLLLDDVLSELDGNRQEYLLESINDIQTIITCTGLDEFVKNHFHINKVFYVENGTVTEKSGE